DLIVTGVQTCALPISNGDAVVDRSFRIRFSEVNGGSQTATVHLATGALAAQLNDGGPVVIAGAPASFGREPIITQRGAYKFFAEIGRASCRERVQEPL